MCYRLSYSDPLLYALRFIMNLCVMCFVKLNCCSSRNCDDVISYIMTFLLTSLPPSSPPSPPCGKIRMISMTVVKALSYIACSLTRAAGKRKDKGVFCKPSFEEVKATRCNMCLCAVNRYICPEWSRMWEWFILGKCRVQITALSHGNTSFLLRHFRKMSV